MGDWRNIVLGSIRMTCSKEDARAAKGRSAGAASFLSRSSGLGSRRVEILIVVTSGAEFVMKRRSEGEKALSPACAIWMGSEELRTVRMFCMTWQR